MMSKRKRKSASQKEKRRKKSNKNKTVLLEVASNETLNFSRERSEWRHLHHQPVCLGHCICPFPSSALLFPSLPFTSLSSYFLPFISFFLPFSSLPCAFILIHSVSMINSPLYFLYLALLADLVNFPHSCFDSIAI